MVNENLSELIFGDSGYPSPETSTLLRSFVTQQANDFNIAWYRVLNRSEWAWRGLSIIDIDAVLSKIAVAIQARSNELWLDTVVGYHKGNWSYEWNQLAVMAQQRCDTIEIKEKNNVILSDCLYASLLYSLSSYPYLRGDRLALEAGIFAVNAYKKACSLKADLIKNLAIPYKNSTIQAMLHLPSLSSKPCPVLIVCSGLDSLHVDYYRLYENYLAPAGIAMLTLDAPGLGQHENYPLTEHSSELHEQVIQHLSELSWIDNTKIILLGFKFGSNIAVRTAYLIPNKIKGLICVQPIVDEWFVNKNLQENTATMYKDVFYNRLDSNTLSTEGFFSELSRFSLKKQGLLPRQLNMPFLGIHIDNPHVFQQATDLKLLQQSAKRAKIIKVSNFWRSPKQDCALIKIVNWINQVLA